MNISGICTTPTYFKSDGECACGFFIDQELTWIEAVRECQAYGARLPKITSAKENADIFSLNVSKKNVSMKLTK